MVGIPPIGLHKFGEKRTNTAFFDRINLNLEEYGGLIDSYQWYLCQLFDGGCDNQQVRQELQKIFPEENMKFLKLIDDFDFFVKGRARHTLRLPGRPEEKRATISRIGDYVLTIEQEYEVLAKVSEDLNIKFDTPQIVIDLKEFYDYYLKYFSRDLFIYPLPDLISLD